MSISVTGRGSAAAVPDLAVVDLVCEAGGPTPSAALGSAGSALDEVRAALRGLGLPARDVRSTQMGLWADQDRQGRPAGYRATLGLVVRVREVDRAGEVVTVAVEAGGDAARLGGLRLEVSDPARARVEAREAAWHDAEDTARRLAALAGRELGRVDSVVDGEPAPPRPGPVGAVLAMSAEAVPVEPGSVDVTHVVTVTWALV